MNAAVKQRIVVKFADVVKAQTKQSTCACCKKTLTAFSSIRIIGGVFVCAKDCVAR